MTAHDLWAGTQFDESPPLDLHHGDDQSVNRATLRAAELRARMVNTHSLDTLPDREPLIRDLLSLDSINWLYGKPGSGKSFVALDWAGCVALGIPWQRHEVAHRGPVLYLIAEGAQGFKDRVRAWEKLAGQTMDEVEFLPVPVQLLDMVDLHALVTVASEIHPAMVVIDTQARVTLGVEENSARDMGRVVDAADRVRQATSAAVLLVHHEGRNGEHPRGSSVVDGAADATFRTTKDGPWVRLDNTKQKDGTEADPVLMRLASYGDSAVLHSQTAVGVTPEITAAEDQLLEVMRESFGSQGAHSGQLRRVANMPDTTYYRALNLLVTRGLLHKSGSRTRPFYELPEATDET